MNSHPDYRDYSSSSYSSSEESLPLFDEKTLSDLESEVDKSESKRRFSSLSWTDNVRPYIRTLRVSSWKSTLGRTSFALLPSFVQCRICKDDSPPPKVYPTAYLDGMRGLAALFVFFCHYAYGFFVITKGYGYQNEYESNNHFLQLPIIRLLYSGPPMVCVFFVISGYALSLKPLKLMRSRSWDALSTTMTSSIFRRGLRLFLPTTISTFMVFVMLRLGWYEKTREFAQDQTYFRNVREQHPFINETTTEQFYDWLWKLFEFVHVWSWQPFGGSTPYDVHLWTIPVEFRSSMVLFLALMGLSKVKIWIRWVALTAVTWFAYRNDRWEMVLFFSGMFLAELDLVRIARRSASPTSPILGPLTGVSEKAKTRSHGSVKKYFWILFGIFAMYLMSQPDEAFENTPGWRYLSSLIPSWFSEKYRYWQVVGSILLVFATNMSPTLQRPYNTAFVQYFGKISYAIYLMHGPVLHTAGYMIMRWAWGVTGISTQREYVSGFLLGGVFIVPLVIWAADLFWRFCDAPVVRLARWLEDRCEAGDKR